MKRFTWSLFAVTIGVTAIACWGKWSNFSIPLLTKQSTSVLQGKELIGATLTSFDERGRSLKLKIEDIQPDSEDKDGGSYLYTVIYYSATDNSWYHLCQPDLAGITQAIPLTGRWDKKGAYIDDDSITFACTNGALGKCVRWGYKPWKSIKGKSLRDYHQACTRMVRADYCGNGIGHTKDGTPIDVYDRLGIQKRTKKSGMSFEAGWNVDGAVYLKRIRFPEAISQLQQECPEKLIQMLSSQKADSSNSLPRLSQTSASTAKALLFNDSFIPKKKEYQ